MNRLPLILSSVAVAIFAGCATESSIRSAPPPVVVAPASGTVAAPQPSSAGTVVVPTAGLMRVGLGRIESILAVPATASSPSTQRIVMRMDDASVQYFDTQAAGLAVGDRIEITKDGTLRHPA